MSHDIGTLLEVKSRVRILTEEFMNAAKRDNVEPNGVVAAIVLDSVQAVLDAMVKEAYLGGQTRTKAGKETVSKEVRNEGK